MLMPAETLLKPLKHDIPTTTINENPRKSKKIREKRRIWGLGGLGCPCYCKFYSKISPKLRRIILLRFHFGKTMKPIIFMAPKPILFIFGDTKNLQIIQENGTSFQKYDFGKSRYEKSKMLKCWNRRASEILNIRHF